MGDFKKWNSINKFSDAYHMAQKHRVGDVTCRLKIKLHGTNAGIRLEADGKLVAQKRTSDVFSDADNAGFANWVTTLKRNPCSIEYFKNFIIYGEWAGQGIRRNHAVSQIPKTFFIFAIDNLNTGSMTYDPELITNFLPKIFDAESVDKMKVLPWFGMAMYFNLLSSKPGKITPKQVIDKIVDDVDAIGEIDPYIKAEYGIEGVGEGVVGYFTQMSYQDGTQVPHNLLNDYMFKVKSEAHSVNSSKNRNFVQPVKAEGVDEFIEMFFTENRFKQMLDEHCGGVADKKQSGTFMKAVMSDVHKESVNEIEVADFEWKDVPKYATVVTRQWFFDQCDKL